jgi:hypothetical protein
MDLAIMLVLLIIIIDFPKSLSCSACRFFQDTPPFSLICIFSHLGRFAQKIKMGNENQISCCPVAVQPKHANQTYEKSRPINSKSRREHHTRADK